MHTKFIQTHQIWWRVCVCVCVYIVSVRDRCALTYCLAKRSTISNGFLNKQPYAVASETLSPTASDPRRKPEYDVQT